MRLEELPLDQVLGRLLDSGLEFGFDRRTSDDRTPREMYDQACEESTRRMWEREGVQHG